MVGFLWWGSFWLQLQQAVACLDLRRATRFFGLCHPCSGYHEHEISSTTRPPNVLPNLTATTASAASLFSLFCRTKCFRLHPGLTVASAADNVVRACKVIFKKCDGLQMLVYTRSALKKKFINNVVPCVSFCCGRLCHSSILVRPKCLSCSEALGAISFSMPTSAAAMAKRFFKNVCYYV